jgi:hypothetical protein
MKVKNENEIKKSKGKLRQNNDYIKCLEKFVSSFLLLSTHSRSPEGRKRWQFRPQPLCQGRHRRSAA